MPTTDAPQRSTTTPPVSARAWTMLALGVAAQAAGTLVVSAPALLIPHLLTRGTSLPVAGVLAAAPTFGMVLTLIAWGAITDRFGERVVIAGGLVLTTLAVVAAWLAAGDPVLLGLAFLAAGMTSASTNAASGRVVVGWFPKERRGLAMGIRQMSQPLGVTLAAVTVPQLAEGSGIRAALVLPIVLCAVLAVCCAIGITDPPRPARTTVATTATANPYRSSGFLWRVHAVSVLLVVPQFTLSTYGLVWLVGLGWSTPAAGLLVGAAQFVGAIGRILVGGWSDRAGSRVGPLRIVAVSAAVVMAVLAVVDATHLAGAAVFLVLATSVTVADNGLAYTSVAEAAGPFWSGRALGAQNTGQFIAASAVGPGIGALVGALGFAASFGIVAVLPLLAVPLVPRRDRHD
ncbi:MFS transporter [Curtobacterium flaccumfaciens pv. flaccumfaciens]|uniref:MFS transporter n=1 Tax=Curtobacterium flaccumfaciens TaxID=2035 RepID=UPI002659D8B5|nr:MFS transporter [Curtobacterium flaccumfaciens]MCS5509630.1 MFS transporter [Curtobacterium flaccumfaciens pv. flaccumfaciens]MCX2787476.1 MFS transporter [Curtobacterium flaccumfaciens pv. flaccumfaciens]